MHQWWTLKRIALAYEPLIDLPDHNEKIIFFSFFEVFVVRIAKLKLNSSGLTLKSNLI